MPIILLKRRDQTRGAIIFTLDIISLNINILNVLMGETFYSPGIQKIIRIVYNPRQNHPPPEGYECHFEVTFPEYV